MLDKIYQEDDVDALKAFVKTEQQEISFPDNRLGYNCRSYIETQKKLLDNNQYSAFQITNLSIEVKGQKNNLAAQIARKSITCGKNTLPGFIANFFNRENLMLENLTDHSGSSLVSCVVNSDEFKSALNNTALCNITLDNFILLFKTVIEAHESRVTLAFLNEIQDFIKTLDVTKQTDSVKNFSEYVKNLIEKQKPSNTFDLCASTFVETKPEEFRSISLWGRATSACVIS